MNKNINILTKTLIAHRGYHNKYIKENSKESFIEAIKKGYTIELDINITKDKKIIVFHNKKINRIKIEELTYKEIKDISNTNIITLKEVLDLTKGKVPLLIEIKAKYNKETLNIISKILDTYNKDFAIQSFNIKIIRWFKKYRNNYLRGILISNKNYKSIKKFLKYNIYQIYCKPDFLSCNYKLGQDKIIINKRHKLKVLGWTITNKKDYNTYKLYFDNLICDNMEEKYDRYRNSK